MRTDEFAGICMEHVKKYPDMFHVRIEETKTSVPRSFSITGSFVDVVVKYMNLRPSKTLTTRFFVNYQKSKCTTQVIGKTKFSKMPRQIAEFLHLQEPERYTGN